MPNETIASITVRESLGGRERDIIQVTSDNRVLVISMDQSKEQTALAIPPLVSITLSSDGQFLCGYDKKGARILVLKTENPSEVVATIAQPDVEFVGFSPKKRFVVVLVLREKNNSRRSWSAISYDGSVMWQDAPKTGHPVCTPIFSDSGELVAFGSTMGSVQNAKNGKWFASHGLPLAFSFDDSQVAGTQSALSVRDCNLGAIEMDATGSRKLRGAKPLIGHTDKVTHLHFSVDGKRLFTDALMGECEFGIQKMASSF